MREFPSSLPVFPPWPCCCLAAAMASILLYSIFFICIAPSQLAPTSLMLSQNSRRKKSAKAFRVVFLPSSLCSSSLLCHASSSCSVGESNVRHIHNAKHFIKNAWSATTRISPSKGPLRRKKTHCSHHHRRRRRRFKKEIVSRRRRCLVSAPRENPILFTWQHWWW